jgi:hypothetical protein
VVKEAFVSFHSATGRSQMGLGHAIPTKGDLVEQSRLGIRRLGVVWYSDQLQVLVKWEDGTSSSLRLGRDDFSIRSAEEDVGSSNGAPPFLAPVTDSAQEHGEARKKRIPEKVRKPTLV